MGIDPWRLLEAILGVFLAVIGWLSRSTVARVEKKLDMLDGAREQHATRLALLEQTNERQWGEIKSLRRRNFDLRNLLKKANVVQFGRASDEEVEDAEGES